MTIMITVRYSCTRPIITWLPSINAGSGQFHIICPMEKYIRTSKKPTEYNKRFFKIGVSWSARASSEAAALFAPPFFSPSASFADAP